MTFDKSYVLFEIDDKSIKIKAIKFKVKKEK
jgi:hypothetical protein